jgi:tryptophan-rich sensory protein
MTGRIAGLAGWLLLSFAVASLGALASIDAQAFYARLHLPAWAPPGWLFGPVWTLLYALMAAAAWLVWCRAGSIARRDALVLFVVQLVPNALWSWLFFRWHRGALSFADIVLLWLLVVATVLAFRRLRPLAAALLLPYLAWLSFALVLNLVVWRLNPQIFG